MKKNKILVGIIVGLFLVSLVSVQADSLILEHDQVFVATGDVRGEVYRAQTFELSSDITVTRVQLALCRQGTSQGDVTIGIYETDASHHPTGSALTEASIAGSTISATTSPFEDADFNWYEFDVSDVSLLGSTEYAIQAKYPNGSGVDFRIIWSGNSSGTYTDGAQYYTTDAGSTWKDGQNSWDMDFRIYGSTNSAPSTPTLNSPADGSIISDTTPDLKANVSDPDGDNIVKYDIKADDNSDFSSPEINLTNQTCNVVSGGVLTHTCSELTAGQKYYWKLRVADPDLEWSNWTDGTWDFTIKYEFHSVTIQTNKSSYYPTEQVETIVTVKDKDGSLLSGCTVTGDISKGATSHTLNFSDNGDGTYTAYYTILTSDENGEWTAEATVAYTNYVNKTENTSYTLTRLALNVTLTTDYDSYMPGDTINIEVTVKDPYTDLILSNPTLDVIVDEKNGTTHDVSMIDSDGDGTFEGSWTIPTSYYAQIAAMLYQKTTWQVKATAQDPNNKASEKTETKDITVEIRTLDVTTEYNRTTYNPGDEVECTITVKDSVTDKGVASATIDWDAGFNRGVLATNEDGQATLTFNIPANRKTNFTLEITAHKTLYNSKTIDDVLTICLLDISVTYDKAQYGAGDVVEISVLVQDGQGNYKSNADLDITITKPDGIKEKTSYSRLGNGKYRVDYTIPDKEGTYKTQILVTTEDDLRGSNTSEFYVSSLNMNLTTLDPITETQKSKFTANGLIKIKAVIKDSENTLLPNCDVDFGIYTKEGTEVSTGSLFEESAGVYKATTTLPSSAGDYTVKINAQSGSGTCGTASSTITIESAVPGGAGTGGLPVEGSSIIVALAMIGGVLFVVILLLIKLR